MKRGMGRFAMILLALLVAQPALAETRELKADQTKEWRHKRTKAVFPAQLAGLQRTQMVDFGKNELDIAATYGSLSGGTEATVYLFQAGLPDASIWHDRIVSVMKAGRLGKFNTAEAKTATFAPPLDPRLSAIRTVAPFSEGQVTASGVAVFPRNGWLVAVRISSLSASAEELDRQLEALVAQLQLEKPQRDEALAYAIGWCADDLALKDAERAEADPGAALLGGIMGQMVESGEAKPADPPSEPVKFCRDKASTRQYSTYRAGGSKDAFLLAFGDAGTAAFAGKDSLGTLLDEKKSTIFSVSAVTIESRLTFRGFKSLPTPAQVATVFMTEQPQVRTSRIPGDKKKQTIYVSP